MDVVTQKRQASKDFVFNNLSEMAAEYGFELTWTSETGKAMKGSLIEPKEFGIADEAFRKNCIENENPAVLVARYNAV